jgi:hypothetical protein
MAIKVGFLVVMTGRNGVSSGKLRKAILHCGGRMVSHKTGVDGTGLGRVVAGLSLIVALGVVGIPLTARGQESNEQSVTGAAAQSEQSSAPVDIGAAVRDLGGGNYELNGIRFDSRSREIVFDGVVNLDDELLEYALVNERGAIHEALIRTTARPFDLQVVLLLLRYQPFKEGLFEGFDRAAESAEPGETGAAEEVPQMARLSVTVRWHQDGEKRTSPLSDWILDTSSGQPMRRGFWQFSGLPDPGSSRHWKIEHESNFIGIYLDAFSPINFPYEGNRSDEVWLPNRKRLPPIETPVEIVLGAYDESVGRESDGFSRSVGREHVEPEQTRNE